MTHSRRRALVLLAGLMGAACSPRAAETPPPTTVAAATAAATATGPTGIAATAGRSPTMAPAAQPTAPPTRPLPSLTMTPMTTSGEPTATSVAFMTGVDVLLHQRVDVLRGRKLGLITNTTGRDGRGSSTIDLLKKESAWQLLALFSPEHGIRGDAAAGAAVDASVDPMTGLPVHSLYGETIRPTAAMLHGLDTLVYDIQDVGARTYTYTSTLLEVMRAAAAHGLPVVVLDRPNPIGGDQAEGNVLDAAFTSFVGAGPIAMRYGLTIGELGGLLNAEMSVGADLTIVPLQGWQRSDWFDATGLSWVDPSPNLRSLNAAALYPGTVLVEGSNLSEGRGTDRPFEWIGAPWIDAAAWADHLNHKSVAGVRFTPASRTPDTSKFAGQLCQGVLIEIVDRLQLRPMELGVAVLETARTSAPTKVQLMPSGFDRLAGTDGVRTALESGAPASEIVAAWQPELERFRRLRQRYFLY